MNEKISSALRRLELSVFEQTIYLSLLTEGQASARILAARTGITRPSVYDQLKALIALNLVVELDIEGKAEFAAADIKYLDALLADRIDRLEQSREFLAEALPSLQILKTVTPKLRFFAGGEGVKQLLKDIMWHDKTSLHIIWPERSMNTVFDPLFLAWFDERRLTRKLSAKVAWVRDTNKVTSTLFTGGPDDIRLVLAKEKTLTMATIIYDSKVAHVSNHTEAFGFIVESAEYAASEREKFNALWR